MAWDLCDFHKLLVCCVNLIFKNLVNCQLQEQVDNLQCSPLFSLPLFYFFLSSFLFLFLIDLWSLLVKSQYLLAQLSLPRVCTITFAGLEPKRCKLAETKCILQNCIEICLKTPNAQFELKNSFLLLLLFFFFCKKLTYLFHV